VAVCAGFSDFSSCVWFFGTTDSFALTGSSVNGPTLKHLAAMASRDKLLISL